MVKKAKKATKRAGTKMSKSLRDRLLEIIERAPIIIDHDPVENRCLEREIRAEMDEIAKRDRILAIIRKAEKRAIKNAGGPKAYRRQIEKLADQLEKDGEFDDLD